MKLLNTTLRNSIQVLVRFLISILNIKIIAVLVGPSGMALVSQLTNVLQVGASISGLGIKSGVVKYIAEHKDNKEKQNDYISTSIISVLIMSVIVGLVTLIFAKSLSSYTFKTEIYTGIFRYAGIFMISSSLLNLFISILNGLEKQKAFIILNIILSVSGFMIALAGILLWGLEGLLWSQIFLTTIATLVGIGMYKKIVHLPPRIFSTDILKKLSKYSAMTLFSAVAGPLLLFTLRNIIISTYDLETAGLWEGINKISNSYILILTSAFSYYFIPTFAQLKSNKGIVKEVLKSYKLLIPLLLLGGLSIFIAKDLIIKLLYTSDFKPMRDLFIWQTIGDFFKIQAWVIGMLLIAKARVKTYITTEIISITLQIVLLKIISTHLSFSYLNLYYAIENFIYFMMMITVFYFYYVKGEKSKL